MDYQAKSRCGVETRLTDRRKYGGIVDDVLLLFIIKYLLSRGGGLQCRNYWGPIGIQLLAANALSLVHGAAFATSKGGTIH